MPWEHQAYNSGEPVYVTTLQNNTFVATGLRDGKKTSCVAGVTEVNQLLDSLAASNVPFRTVCGVYDLYPSLCATVTSGQGNVTVGIDGTIVNTFEASKKLERGALISIAADQQWLHYEEKFRRRDPSVAVCSACPTSAALAYNAVTPDVHGSTYKRVSRRRLYQLLFSIPEAQTTAIMLSSNSLVSKCSTFSMAMWWNESGAFLEATFNGTQKYGCNVVGNSLTCSHRHPWKFVNAVPSSRPRSMTAYWKTVFERVLCQQWKPPSPSTLELPLYDTVCAAAKLPSVLIPTSTELQAVTRKFLYAQEIPSALSQYAAELLRANTVKSEIWDSSSEWGVMREYASKVAVETINDFCKADHAGLQTVSAVAVLEPPPVPQQSSPTVQSAPFRAAPWEWSEEVFENAPMLFKQACGAVMLKAGFGWNIWNLDGVNKPETTTTVDADGQSNTTTIFKEWGVTGTDEELKLFWLYAYLKTVPSEVLMTDKDVVKYYDFWPKDVVVGSAVWAELFQIRKTERNRVPVDWTGAELDGTRDQSYAGRNKTNANLTESNWNTLRAEGRALFNGLVYCLTLVPNTKLVQKLPRGVCRSRNDHAEVVHVDNVDTLDAFGPKVHVYVTPNANFPPDSTTPSNVITPFTAYNNKYMEANAETASIHRGAVPRAGSLEWAEFKPVIVPVAQDEFGEHEDSYGYVEGKGDSTTEWKDCYNESKLELWYLRLKSSKSYLQYVHTQIYQQLGELRLTGGDRPSTITITGFIDDQGHYFRHGETKRHSDGKKITGRGSIYTSHQLSYTCYGTKDGTQLIASPHELCTAAQAGLLSDKGVAGVLWKAIHKKSELPPSNSLTKFFTDFTTARPALQWAAPYFDPACAPGSTWEAEWHLSELQLEARSRIANKPDFGALQAAKNLLNPVSRNKDNFKNYVMKLAWAFRHGCTDKEYAVSTWNAVWINGSPPPTSVVHPNYLEESYHNLWYKTGSKSITAGTDEYWIACAGYQTAYNERMIPSFVRSRPVNSQCVSIETYMRRTSTEPTIDGGEWLVYDLILISRDFQTRVFFLTYKDDYFYYRVTPRTTDDGDYGILRVTDKIEGTSCTADFNWEALSTFEVNADNIPFQSGVSVEWASLFNDGEEGDKEFVADNSNQVEQ